MNHDDHCGIETLDYTTVVDHVTKTVKTSGQSNLT